LQRQGIQFSAIAIAQGKLFFLFRDPDEGRITDCNLSQVEIDRCEMQGLKINGIPVEELLQAYGQWKK
jgi:hypothetical protein